MLNIWLRKVKLAELKPSLLKMLRNSLTLHLHLINQISLKDNLEKILSNKKLTHLCFDFDDGKEQQEILTALSTKNKGLKIDDVILESLFY